MPRHSLSVLLRIAFVLTLSFQALSAQQPDTTTNRHATAADAAYWPTVNEGDYIIFRGNADSGNAVFMAGSQPRLVLGLGKKILIWRGEYTYIAIDGSECVNTETQPTIITNLGGQVKWGYNEDPNSGWRRLELNNFNHVFLTGKYDPVAQTGHPDWLGHDGGANMNQPDYYERYGMWGHPKWSGMRFRDSVSNIVRILNFKSAKLSYVAASEGGFAGFNVKTDAPAVPERVKVDIQDCFSAWIESEAVYISWSTGAEDRNLTELVLRNNIFAYNGCETIQSDNLTNGSIIENNIGFTGSCFHRRPFQSLFQDGLHQFSFVEGGVMVRNNIMITSGGMLHQFRFKDPGPGRAFPHPDLKAEMRNNYYGYSRSNIGYFWEGDGITPYVIDGNVYGPVSTPSTRDGYIDQTVFNYYFKVCNATNDILLTNITYPLERDLYGDNDCGASKVTTVDNVQAVAPLVEFVNSGFPDDTEYRDFTFWSPIYTTTTQDNKGKNGQFIPYKVGEYVFYYDDNGNTRFFRCIQAHSGDFNPNTSPDKWELLQWNGRNLPPLDLRLRPGSHYANLGMGLNFSPPHNPDTYSLTMAASTGGSTTPTPGTHQVDQGVPVPIAATANPGNTFSAWSSSPNASIANPASATTTVTLSGNATVTANFTDAGGGSPWTILTPANSGAATASYFPMNHAFDAQPVWDGDLLTPVGVSGGENAPYYDGRHGFIDFGPDYSNLRIVGTWTQYRTSSEGNQTPYAELWWDNNSGIGKVDAVSETRFNFNSAQALPSTGQNEPWVRDADTSSAPITPPRRYLILRSADPMISRAKEYAFVGYIETSSNTPPSLVSPGNKTIQAWDTIQFQINAQGGSGELGFSATGD